MLTVRFSADILAGFTVNDDISIADILGNEKFQSKNPVGKK